MTSIEPLSSRSFAAGISSAAGPLKVDRGVDDRSGRSGRGGAGSGGRPSSLSLPVPVLASGSGGDGSVTTTPMSFTSLGLDCMVDGHTGLTPITGAPSCSAGGQRSHDDTSTAANAAAAGLHHDRLSPTTLMTL